MIVYAESNFVLELALLQEQHSACESLLQLSESGRIQLVLPAFAVVEPYGTLFRRRAERRSVKRTVDPTLRELGRSAPLVQSVSDVTENLSNLLIVNSDDEFQRWKSVRRRLAGIAELISFDESVGQSAIEAETRLDLTPPDAVIMVRPAFIRNPGESVGAESAPTPPTPAPPISGEGGALHPPGRIHAPRVPRP